VPEAVNVLGRRSREGGTAITREPPGAVRLGSAFEQTALSLQRLLVNLALDPRADLVRQKHPICTQLCVRQSLPECLAEAQQQLHGDIVLFEPRRRDRDFQPAMGYGRFPNVINAVQMDRILAPTRPYNAVVRPSDGKSPSNIAFVLCTGSRDEKADNRLCSRVCCMYSLKQAQLLMGALPLADITIYYIDIRSYGKGYEEFYQQAKGMGVYFVKGKVARIEETADQDLLVHYEDIEGDGGMKQARHDLVVLSVGMLPSQGYAQIGRAHV
jgi:hypothetical protein